MTTSGTFKMRNSFVLVFLLGCFCLGVSALKCNVCDGKGCPKQEEKECDKKFDRCLDVAYYGRSINPMGNGKTSFMKKTVQVDKLCADEKTERKMCKKSEKKKGFCKSCKEDGCNKETYNELSDRVEKGKKEKHERKTEKREAKKEKKIRKEEKKKLKYQKKQEKEERKKAKYQAKHDKDVKKEERKKQEEEANQNKKKEKQEEKKAENVNKDEKKAKEKENKAEKIKESPK